MHFIPFVRGKVKLDMTRVEFVERLVELTEKDYPIIPAFAPLPTDNFKEYSREVYDNSFLLWRTVKPFRKLLFLFTTIYVRLIDEPDNTISIRYLIRFNFFNIAIIGIMLIGMLFAAITSSLMFLLYALIIYVLWLFAFHYMASDDQLFLEHLSRRTYPWRLI